MKILLRVIPAAVLAGAALVSPGAALAAPTLAAAMKAPAASDNRNAALYYWRAFYSLDRDFQRASGDMLDSNRTAEWTPSETAITKLKENNDFIIQVLVATRIDKCDFGIAYDEGFMALLPHLGLFRQGARILALDAHRLMMEEKPDDAAERIAGIYRMAVHLRNDNVLISSLVSIAVASLAADEATMFAKAGKLTDAGRATIAAAIQPLNQADGFGTKRCIDMERRITIDYMRKTLKGPQAGKKLLEVGVFDLEPANKEKILALDEAGANKELDRMEGSYREMLAVWDSPSYEKGLADFQAKLERGEFGILAQVLTPALGKAKLSDVKAAARVSEVLRTLSEARHREPAPAADKNSDK